MKIQNLFGFTHKLISNHSEEILNVKTIASTNASWTRSLVSHDQVIKWAKAKVYVYSDSVLCLEKMLDHLEASQRWKGQVADFQLSASYAKLLGIDGEQFEFEFNILPGLTSLQILQMIQSDSHAGILNQKNLEIVSSACPCSMTLIGQRRETKRIVFQIQTRSRCTPRDSRKHWTFFGPGNETKWFGNRNYKPEGKRDSVASQMVQRFKETEHPVFTGASALSRGILKRLTGKETIHFNAAAQYSRSSFKME